MGGNIIRILRVLADYQFGKGAGKALFPKVCRIQFSSTGRIRQIFDGDKRIATLKADTGFFSLGIEGARRLHAFFEYPRLRVVVKNEVSDAILKGGNVFAKHVVDVDRSIKANDEVLIVNENDELLGTGKAKLSAAEMLEFDRGIAVSTRKSILKAEKSVNNK